MTTLTGIFRPSDLPATGTVAVSNYASFLENWRAQNAEQSSYSSYGKQGIFEQLLDQYEAASSPNWDGYGADAVSQTTYLAAYRFVESLPSGGLKPTVAAESDGHLTLEWYRHPGRLLSVSISPEGELHYAALLGGSGKTSGTVPFYGDTPQEILCLIRRVSA